MFPSSLKRLIEDEYNKSIIEEEKDAEYIIDVVKEHPNSWYMNISNNALGDIGVKVLASVLKDTEITSLDLSFNSIEDEGAKEFAKVLKDSKITSLNLSGNKIVDVDELITALNNLITNESEPDLINDEFDFSDNQNYHYNEVGLSGDTHSIEGLEH